MSFDGAPSSGTTGTLAGYIEPGGFLFDKTNGVLFINEGTKDSPYYTPVGFRQRPLFGVHADFGDGVGIALADTAAAYTVPGSGLRIFGHGKEVSDSGLVVQTATVGGKVGRLTTTATASRLIALGMEAGVMKPSTGQLLVIDVEFTNVTAITLRGIWCGFLGTAADALDVAATCAATTITMVQDDMAGLLMHVGLTAATELFAPHNKADEAASILTTATGVDTGVVMPAAATYTRLRVEIDANGTMRCFKDKAEITKIASAWTPATAGAPVFYIESTSAAVKNLDVRQFATWSYR